MTRSLLVLVYFLVFVQAKSGGASCTSDFDCQLNGVCNSNQCTCDPSWTGSDCSQLNLLPTPRDSGFHDPVTSTWGGNIIFNATEGLYHMWIAEMDNHCGLTSWQVNSQIRHVTSTNITGPYERQEVIVPVWSHNPIVLTAPDGTLVLYHIGTGQGSKEYTCPGENGTSPCGFLFSCDNVLGCPAVEGYTCYSGYCSGDGNSFTDCGADISEPLTNCDGSNVSACAQGAATQCDKTQGCESFGLSNDWGLQKTKLFSANASGLVPNPQWSVWVRNDANPLLHTKFSKKAGTLNKASTFPMHYAKSTAGPWYPYTATATTDTSANNPAPWMMANGSVLIVFNDGGMTMYKADTWQGPYSYHSNNACGGGEDPFIYQDKRGNFHCLYHRSPWNTPDVAIGHAYSTDSYTWHVSEGVAASSTINYDPSWSFGPVVFGKRERPKLMFDKNGNILQFITGVCINPQCNPWANGGVQDPINCASSTQYEKCDQDFAPGWFDYTFTHIQPVAH